MLPYAEPYRIKMIEPMIPSERSQREKWIREARYNLFNLKSQQVFIDLLTDSGTGAMSQEQWSAMMSGDESYAGSSSFEILRETITSLTGFPYVLPTHQGRAAENVLFSVLVKKGDMVPGNAHFDTTKGHIEFRKASAVDCTIDVANNISVNHPFKGNLDIYKLEEVLESSGRERIPLILVTLTCNSTGGQPVSMENLKSVRHLADRYGIPVIYDAARSIRDIVLEMFSYADGMTMSSKKDGIVNMGGFIALRNEALYREASVFNILFEGYLTYGGMSGRDMAALAQGLKEATSWVYLESRIRQVAYLGEQLKQKGIPVQEPFGGHAIFVDAGKFLPHVPQEEFVAQTLALELYLESGVRAVEIGTLLADRDPETRENRFPRLEMVRLTIPRRVYTRNHMDYVAAAMGNIFQRRNEITSGYRIIYEPPIMRHFTVELEKIERGGQ
jgi:tyrosine phenol-lyase